MELNVNSPQYYSDKFGIDDEIYRLCQEIYQYFKDKSYSEYINIIGIIPIVAPKEMLDRGLCKNGKHCELKYGFASIRKSIDFEKYVLGDIEKKKELIAKCILDAVKSIKMKGKIDFESFEKDFLVFCKNNNISF